MTIPQSVCERCATVNRVPRVTVLRHKRAVTYYWTCIYCGNEWSTTIQQERQPSLLEDD